MLALIVKITNRIWKIQYKLIAFVNKSEPIRKLVNMKREREREICQFCTSNHLRKSSNTNESNGTIYTYLWRVHWKMVLLAKMILIEYKKETHIRTTAIVFTTLFFDALFICSNKRVYRERHFHMGECAFFIVKN